MARRRSRPIPCVPEASAFKIKLGVPPAHVFHSFRQNVATILRNRLPYGDEGTREQYIDDLIGHERMNNSVRSTTYKDQTSLVGLNKTANAITYPEFWGIRTIAISRRSI